MSQTQNVHPRSGLEKYHPDTRVRLPRGVSSEEREEVLSRPCQKS